MSARDQIAGYLRDIGERLGMTLTLDANDTCSLTCEDDLQCNVTVPDSSELLVLHCPLLPATGQNRAELFERALAMNLYGGETEGCALAYDAAINGLVLCLVQPAAGLDAGGFGNLLGNFIQTAGRVAAALEGRTAREEADGSEADGPAEISETSGNFMQNLHLRA